MTEKLYYNQPFLKEFTATISEIQTDEKTTKLILDKTAFFPEGGGQECDTGSIGDYSVIKTIEENGKIFHIIKGKTTFSIGDSVNCKVDFEKRFPRMQSHTGEHIVSGIAHKLYGVENVGFHMDENCVMTVDFDKYLNHEEIEELELSANRCVYGNLPVTSEVLTQKDAENREYRSKKEILSDIRIVTIKDTDVCACCAPHCEFTGQIGIIKITSVISHRGGCRLTIICGETAFSDYREKAFQVGSLAKTLVVAQSDLIPGFEKFAEKNAALKAEKDALFNTLCSFTAAGITTDKKINVHFVQGFSMPMLVATMSVISQKTDKTVILLSQTENGGYNYAMYSAEIKLNQYVKEFNLALSGRGGGKPDFVQGCFNACKEEIINYFHEAEVNLP